MPPKKRSTSSNKTSKATTQQPAKSSSASSTTSAKSAAIIHPAVSAPPPPVARRLVTPSISRENSPVALSSLFGTSKNSNKRSAGDTPTMLFLKRVLFRVALLAVFVFLWFKTQGYLAMYQLSDDGNIGDGVHNFLLPLTNYIHKNPKLGDWLLIASSVLIDAFAIFMMLYGVFGPTLRPIVAICFVFVMRQLCQFVVTLPAPKRVFWRDPGYPSLLVTFDTANDFFFSGHTAIAVVCAVEIVRILDRRPIGVFVGAAFAVFEIFTVLVLQAHWTMDVFAGAIAARYATLVSERVLRFLDFYLPYYLRDRDDREGLF